MVAWPASRPDLGARFPTMYLGSPPCILIKGNQVSSIICYSIARLHTKSWLMNGGHELKKRNMSFHGLEVDLQKERGIWLPGCR